MSAELDVSAHKGVWRAFVFNVKGHLFAPGVTTEPRHLPTPPSLRLLILFLLLPSSSSLLHAPSLRSTGCQRGTGVSRSTSDFTRVQSLLLSGSVVSQHTHTQYTHTQLKEILLQLDFPVVPPADLTPSWIQHQSHAALGHKYAAGWRVRWME